MYVRKNVGLIIIIVVFLFIGATFLALGGVMGAIEKSQRRGCSVQTTATVVEIDAKHSSNANGMVYAPVLMYKAEDGSPYTVTPKVYSNPCKYEVGDTVEIRFNPENPNRFYIKGGLGMFLFAYIFGGIGAVFFVIGMILLAVMIFSIRHIAKAAR